MTQRQRDDGHWVFELEADATIPAEYVLLEHYLDRIEPELQRKIGVYLRRIQGSHGGWPLFHDGAFDLSASVKAYYALRCIGDPADAPHMVRAREAILRAGGAERCNVFSRIQLALFGQVPWHAAPCMPVEIMLLPRWFFFHLSKISYWSRTVMVPLIALMALRPQARNPNRVQIAELFRTPPADVRDWIRGPYRSAWGRVFKAVDIAVRHLEPLLPRRTRARAVQRAVGFVTERLNGEDGLGAIYPAMANTVMLFHALGYPPDHPDAAIAWTAIRKLLVIGDTEAYCQPCLSPIWDTSLAGHAVAEAMGATQDVDAACQWLVGQQITEIRGDWADIRPHAPPGGWAFQYANPHYPDVDDTAVVGMLLHRNGDPAHTPSIERARDWILGMQSANGGWGAFDADNTHYALNHIPFADHGALLDPPTADVTARCVSFLAQLGMTEADQSVARAIEYLRRDQEPDGSWFGRWGTNYIYGTWSVLCALNAAGLPHDDPSLRRAVDWLLSKQRPDGGWGEDEESYADAPAGEYHTSTASQTAWAMLGLMAAGETGPAVTRAAAFLARTQSLTANGTNKPIPPSAFRAYSIFGTMAIDSFSPSSPSPDSATFSAATADESRSAFEGLGIVVGLAAEARLVRGFGAMVEIGGGDAEGAAAATTRLIGRGARCLLSFGLAGGLDPTLAAGALIVPDVVLSHDGHWPTHPPLAAELGRIGGAVFSGDSIVATASAKRALFQRTGAACVDLESGAVAEQAARHAIPFAVLRAICDPASRSLPQAALAALDSNGRIGPWRVARSALANPRELSALIAIGAEAMRARRALARRVATILRGRKRT